MTIYYNKQGFGKPLVLFHGWGFDGSIWRQLLPDLSRDFEVYTVDLPGFGQSAYMDWPAFKQRLFHFLPEQFAILGWSLGGLYATRLAVEHPERIDQLINVASSPRFIADENWPGIQPSVFEAFYKNILSDPLGVLKQFVQLQSRGQPMPCLKDKLHHTKGLEEGLKALAGWDLRHSLKTFTKPAHFIFGRLDAITPASTMAAMQQAYPRYDYTMFKRSAHMPFLSHQEIFNDLVRDYLL